MNTIFTTFLLVLIIGLWFWALYDFAMASFKEPGKKTIWLLIILLFPLGPLAYMYFRRDLVAKAPRKFEPKFRENKEK